MDGITVVESQILRNHWGVTRASFCLIKKPSCGAKRNSNWKNDLKSPTPTLLTSSIDNQFSERPSIIEWVNDCSGKWQKMVMFIVESKVCFLNLKHLNPKTTLAKLWLRKLGIGVHYEPVIEIHIWLIFILIWSHISGASLLVNRRFETKSENYYGIYGRYSRQNHLWRHHFCQNVDDSVLWRREIMKPMFHSSEICQRLVLNSYWMNLYSLWSTIQWSSIWMLIQKLVWKESKWVSIIF